MASCSSRSICTRLGMREPYRIRPDKPDPAGVVEKRTCYCEGREKPLPGVVSGRSSLAAFQVFVGGHPVPRIPAPEVYLQEDEYPEAGMHPDRDISIVLLRYEV